MGAADIAKGVDHREHDETEREGDAGVRDRAVARLVDHNGARPGEDQRESAKKLGDVFVHIVRVDTASTTQSYWYCEYVNHRFEKRMNREVSFVTAVTIVTVVSLCWHLS
jgi:hypothetical protein